ncbi:uncharacterized protein [Branchiostoma lanceolatum]|uniref:uncharacterized protein n=1 Tax=Branchiostoma lanceolatum TaxID=7740 RepID=UPI003454DBD6
MLNFSIHIFCRCRDTERIREVVLPIVWINESAAVGPDFIRYFWDQVVVRERAGLGGMVAAVSAGGATVLLAAFWYCRQRKNAGARGMRPKIVQVTKPREETTTTLQTESSEPREETTPLLQAGGSKEPREETTPCLKSVGST